MLVVWEYSTRGLKAIGGVEPPHERSFVTCPQMPQSAPVRHRCITSVWRIVSKIIQFSSIYSSCTVLLNVSGRT